MIDPAFDEDEEGIEETAEPIEAAAPASRPEVRPVPRISIQAFCESPDLAATIEAIAGDRRMARTHVKVHTGGLAAAIEFYQDSATPNLIVVETSLGRDPLNAELDRLAEVCDAGTKVIVVGHVNDVELYRDLIRRGISEYMIAPVEPLGMISAISDLYADRTAKPLGRSIAFIGGKGGVGSSTVSHNVAWSIARTLESDVVVADLDLAFGTAGLDFNQDPPQGIAEAINAPERLDDVFLDRLLARCSDHLSLLAAPAMLDRTYDFDETAFAQIIDVAQGGVPALLLDLPHEWTAWVRGTLLSADEVVLTVEPDLGNLRNAKNIVDLLRQARKNDVPPRLVINKVGMAKRPEISVEDFAEALKLTPDAVIPCDPQLFGTAANNGQMIAETDAKSPVVEAFDAIARVITGRSELKRARRGGLSPFLSRLRGKSA
ncbi:MAG: CpaE family protein [Bauldia sp.]|uniref:AAA family ATPase n=1 Tax=Bauldia sp. TaxID=2575872 RepID=UPI001DFE3CD5|nr:CpaE family protein [Bauldia sp.]MCB1495530.1 CpaE family protein [Bauldia sp.]